MRSAIATWAVRVVWTFIVIVVSLIQLHILPELIHNANMYLVIVVSLIFFLSEIMNEWQRDIFVRLDAQAKSLNIIQESMRTEAKLLTLEETTRDLWQRLKSVEPGQRVVINHLGLDMTFAWEKITNLVESLPNVTNLEYRLLILSAESDDLAHFDDDVRGWLTSGRGQAGVLRNKLRELKTHCERENRSLNYEMRTYAAMPVVHGFRVVEPFHAAYVSICRWGGDEFTEYRWGGTSYNLILDISLSDARRDLLEIFDGNFNHYWSTAPQAQGTALPGTPAPT